MKLAEALQARADLNRHIEQIKSRLSNNAIVQEGEEPAEDPQELLDELNESIMSLEDLISRINLTNCNTLLDGRSLTALIARKDCLSIKLSAYRDLVSDASRLAQRATRTEIKVVSTVPVKQIQKAVDAMARDLRLLDNQIQQLNWTTELQ